MNTSPGSLGQAEAASASRGGKPIQFIEVSSDGTLSITAEAMSALEGHQNRKISVVTFCGPLSTGKSYLCNKVLGTSYSSPKDTAFQVSGSSKGVDQPCTDGIMMWDKLIPLTDAKGQDTGIDLIILDAEGLSSSRRGFDIDVKMFAVVILLSS